jgi:hypothetical protein
LSSSYNQTSTSTFTIEYGSGQVIGFKAADTVTLQIHNSDSNLNISNTLIGQVTHEDASISTFHMDGVCGLAFSGLSSVTKPSLIETIFNLRPEMNK